MRAHGACRVSLTFGNSGSRAANGHPLPSRFVTSAVWIERKVCLTDTTCLMRVRSLFSRPPPPRGREAPSYRWSRRQTSYNPIGALPIFLVHSSGIRHPAPNGCRLEKFKLELSDRAKFTAGDAGPARTRDFRPSMFRSFHNGFCLAHLDGDVDHDGSPGATSASQSRTPWSFGATDDRGDGPHSQGPRSASS